MATVDSDELRADARAWYEANWDPAMSTGRWYSLLADARWGYPTWPENWFGRDLATPLARVVREERQRVGALAPPSGIGPTLLAPMLFEHGNDEQRQRLLWGMAAEGLTFAQMLSEPDAGSDLANTQTTAEPDGDQWLVSGSKIWTSNAEVVDYGMLLARTSPDGPKRTGLTFFLLPREQPGVEIHPLRQMTGDARFNQVFINNASLHDRDRLGPVGDGWLVTRTFLAHEKNSYNPAAHEGGPFGPVDLDAPAGDVQARWASQRKAASAGRGAGRLLADLVERAGAGDDPLVRQRQAALWARRKVMGYTNQRSGSASLPTGAVGPISKIGVSELTRGQRELGLGVQGAAGALVDEDAWWASFQYFALSSPSLSIAGGTDEIQRNHLGERVLGLPREPDPERER